MESAQKLQTIQLDIINIRAFMDQAENRYFKASLKI